MIYVYFGKFRITVGKVVAKLLGLSDGHTCKTREEFDSIMEEEARQSMMVARAERRKN